MTTTTVTAKGQVVIPSRIRRHLNIKRGTRLCVVEKNNSILLQPLTEEYFEKAAGVLKGKTSLRVLLEERRREQEIEDRKWRKS
ncbi:MAG: AbrB/MazE/SpoVT family DNA-binding domain-containing protein [Candidatus Omnitrophica bacterium]|nr:AbrB/MazE/SpoVT family DNA-binding domain-containing protein [Candidatus Omnitrophota bacterium]